MGFQEIFQSQIVAVVVVAIAIATVALTGALKRNDLGEGRYRLEREQTRLLFQRKVERLWDPLLKEPTIAPPMLHPCDQTSLIKTIA